MEKMQLNQPTIGIVAEYNPFHNGHLLQLKRARALLGDVPVVVVLSSAFTQRGEPGIVDKWTRALMALHQGVDLVFELPFLFSCNGTPVFCSGAIDILARSHLVSHLVFGLEDPGYNMEGLLNILMQEPLSFKQSLRQGLRAGLSYPRALSRACEEQRKDSSDFLSLPNNSLGLAYVLRLRQKGYPLTPLPIGREGAQHGDLELSPLASAGAIRSALKASNSPLEKKREELLEAMPGSSFSLLLSQKEKGRLFLDSERLWPLLKSLLLRSAPEELKRVDGMDEGLENLFLRQGRLAAGYAEFVSRCTSGRYTSSRVRRQILRLLTGVSRWSARASMRLGPPYIRVLGATERGRTLLRIGRRASELPLVSRLAAQKDPVSHFCSEIEFRASSLYELLLDCPAPLKEKLQTPLLLP